MRSIASHDDFVAEKIQDLLQTAREIIDGNVGVIKGCRKLVSLQHQIDVDALDADFLPIVGIVSETDELPIGDDRENWNPDALAELDDEIQEAQALYKPLADSACAKLIDRFKS